MNILVVGATGELGSAISRLLKSEGHELVLHGFSNKKKLDILAEELGVKNKFIADFSRENDVQSTLKRIDAALSLDSIIYSSGTNPSAASVTNTELQDWQETMSVNLTGPFLTLKHGIPYLRSREHSSIVIISSLFGINAPANRGAYSASKHGINGLVQSAAKEEAGAVRINSVCPGPMWTENVRSIFEKHATTTNISIEDYIKDRQRQIPYGRFLELAECANLVSYLISTKASFITGEQIRISGGEY